MIRPHETPTGSPHAADPGLPLRPAAFFRLFSLCWPLLVVFLAALGLYLGPLALDSTIFIDFGIHGMSKATQGATKMNAI